jgi:hypothetical protein
MKPIVVQPVPASVKIAVGQVDAYFKHQRHSPNSDTLSSKGPLGEVDLEQGDLRLVHAFEKSFYDHEKKLHADEPGYDAKAASTWKIGRYIKQLNQDGLEQMLRNIGLGQDAKKFRDNDVSGLVFSKLTESDMGTGAEGVGIESVGRRKVLAEFAHRTCTAVPPGSMIMLNNDDENTLWSYHEGEHADDDVSDGEASDDSGPDDEGFDSDDDMVDGGENGAHWRFKEGPCPRCPWFKLSRYVGPSILTLLMGLGLVLLLLLQHFPSAHMYTLAQFNEMWEGGLWM